MSSTPSHTLQATVVALLTANLPATEKAITISVLVLSHLVADAIPHWHFCDLARFRELRHRIGAFVEIGGGMVVLPLVLVSIVGWRYFWYGAACVLATNLFDFLVVAESALFKNEDSKVFKWINHYCHSLWTNLVLDRDRVIWEAVTLAILAFIVSLLILTGAPYSGAFFRSNF